MTFKKSLRAALVLVGIIPMVCIGLIITFITVRNLEKNAEDNLLSTAETSGYAFEGYWELQLREVNLMSNINRIKVCLENINLGIVTEEEIAESNYALSDWVLLSDSYLYAYVLNKDGYIISSSDITKIGTYFNDSNTYIDEVLRGESNYISGLTKSLLNEDIDVIRICQAVGTDGVLVLEAASDFYNTVLSNIDIGTSSASYIFDAERNIICGSDRHLLMDEYEEIPVSEMLKDYRNGVMDKSGTDTFVYDNSKFLMSYYIIDDTSWIFVTTQLASDVNQPVTIMWITITIILIIALIIILLICRQLVNKFMSPINILINVFNTAAKENRYISCEMPGNSEFSHLAAGYNEMINKLNEGHDKLNESHDKLDELYREIAAQEEELRQNYLLLGEEHQKIEQLALSDFVTGLDNRQSFEQQLRILVDEYPSLGLIYFNLDGFKAINEIYGHVFGDSCLIEAASRLSIINIKLEALARFGGDEFYAVKVGSKEDILKAAREMIAVMDKPLIIDGIYVHISACVGVSIYPEDGDDIIDIMKKADLALTNAKAKGKSQLAFFEADMQKNLKRQRDVLDVVQGAIENNEIFAVYQPLISVKEGRIYGFETLMRMISKALGFISPVEFIPITETSGDIISLGRWIMIKACLFAKRLLDDGKNFNEISVNVSLVQLNEPDFVSSVLEVLEETGLPSNYLVIEITESVLMADSDPNINKLHELRSHGITIALDDFGTGYSAMSYLFELPIDVLKIDKSFIDDITSDSNKQTICRSIIDMAHALSIKVVVEGIELDEQRIMLEEMGCDLIQGYLYSRPVNENDAYNLFEEFK